MVKRMLSRVDFKVDATVKYRNADLPCTVKNLSLNGIYIVSELDIPMHEELDVRLALSSTNSDMAVEVKGEVVRKEEDGVAVQFKGIELDSFIFLRNIVIYNSGNSDLIDKEYRDYLIWKSDKNEYIPT